MKNTTLTFIKNNAARAFVFFLLMGLGSGNAFGTEVDAFSEKWDCNGTGTDEQTSPIDIVKQLFFVKTLEFSNCRSYANTESSD